MEWDATFAPGWNGMQPFEITASSHTRVSTKCNVEWKLTFAIFDFSGWRV
jgi:hypothetical protein